MRSMPAAFFGHKTFPVLYSYHVNILNSLARVKGLFIIEIHVLYSTLVGFDGHNLLVWDTATSIIGQVCVWSKQWVIWSKSLYFSTSYILAPQLVFSSWSPSAGFFL